MNNTPPPPLHIKAPGVAQLLLFIVLSILLCALCAHAALYEVEQRVVGVLGSVLSGGSALFLLVMLRRAGEILYTLDEGGVHFVRGGGPTIPWSDIEGIKFFSTHCQRYVGLELRDEKEYFRTLPSRQRLLTRMNAAVGFPSVCLNLRDKKSQKQCVEVCIWWLEQEDKR